MLRARRALRLLAGLALVAATSACSVQYRHEVESPGTKPAWKKGMGGWMRYDGYDQGDTGIAGDLQVAVSECRKDGSPVTIRLVGVIHIADAAYYKKIQKLLDATDLVLYEGVRFGSAPEGSVDDSTEIMWTGISGLMGLKAQVAEIDYHRKNWRQVDMMTDVPGEAPARQPMPPEAVAQANEALARLADLRDQLSGLVDLRRMQDAFKHNYAKALAQDASDPEAGFRQIAELVGQLRQAVAELSERTGGKLLQNVEQALERLEGAMRRMAETLITGRNEYLVKALAKDLAAAEKAGKPKTIAIFYGAGHMPDFLKRLDALGYQRGKLNFHTAWAMNTRGFN
ncbi:MAG: hypothetical protein HZA54_16575 [Planctomycetes bacterium]|nr:hypothetical protein [Planctomycetota bacterium]